jgi:hypothetical protein
VLIGQQVLLRTMRIFRIFWIFKNFNVLSVNTIIGRLMVSTWAPAPGRPAGCRAM